MYMVNAIPLTLQWSCNGSLSYMSGNVCETGSAVPPGGFFRTEFLNVLNNLCVI